MKPWQLQVVRAVVADGEDPPRPNWSKADVPFCSEGACRLYDGKRCMALGCRPDAICEPVVVAMSQRLTEDRS